MKGIRDRIAALSPARRDELKLRLGVPPGGTSEGTVRLVAFVSPTLGATLKPEDVRAHLEEHLPVHLIPHSIIVLPELPRTPSGKVDRRALPTAPLHTSVTAAAFVAPVGVTEQTLADIWAELLEVPLGRVSARSHFFELGGHSLLATRVQSRIRQRLSVEIPIRALFENPVLRLLAARLDALAGSSSSAPASAAIVRRPTGPGVLSFSQQRLWILDQLEPGSSAYNVPCAVRMEGTLDVPRLEQALRTVVERHEVLRATFPADDGEARLRILKHVPIHLVARQLLVFPGAPDPEVTQALLGALQEEAQAPFDLSVGPLVRVALCRLTPDDHLLVLTLHHVISDGWSIGVLVRELAELYSAAVAGRPAQLATLTVQYSDYAAWQREQLQGDAYQAQVAFWKKQLEGAPAAIQLTTDRPRPATQTYRGARAAVHVSESLTRKVEALARQQGVTPFTVLLAGFATLLSRYSGQTEVVIGSSFANRPQLELEPLIGFFVNTLPLRVDLAGDPTFIELLQRVHDRLLGVTAHQEMPFDQIVAELRPDRDLGRSPLFQVLFELHNEPRVALDCPGLRMTPLDADFGQAKFDLSLELIRTAQGLEGLLEFSTDLFDARTADRMVKHFGNLLGRLVAEPRVKVSDAPLLSTPERAELLASWARAPHSAQRDVQEQATAHATWAELFEAQVDAHPDARAATDEQSSVTYAELDARANRVAQALAAQGVGPEHTVGMLLNRSIDFLTAVLGVFKAGAAYVPLDPTFPSSRLSNLVSQARCTVILTSPRHLELASSLGVKQVLKVAELVAANAPSGRLHVQRSGRNLAYVFFTSGSTGVPKGAMVEQEGMLNHLFGKVHDLSLTRSDVVIQNASSSFDISVWQFLVALCVGGKVCIASDELALDPFRLLEWVQQEAATVLEIVPSLLRSLLEGIDAKPPLLPSLRWLVVTGEALPPELCNQWLALYPNIPIVNAYGPTECSDDVTHHVVRAPLAQGLIRTPIGRPVPNLFVCVLDGKLSPVPAGVPGEVYVGGVGVGRGYLGSPERTAASFLPDPFGGIGARLYRTGDLARFQDDGTIDFLGRVDHQVKLRGFRIELGEIEATLSRQPGVRHARVVSQEATSGQKKLVAYVVAHAPGLEAEALLQALRDQLPEYMVPSNLIFLDAFPLLTSGKVNLAAFPRAGDAEAKGSVLAPRTPTERAITEIWQELLETERVGVTDNFFDIGGHSLLAIHTVSKVRRKLGVELPVRAIFEASTVEAVARRVDALLLAGGAKVETDKFFVHGVELRALEPKPTYALSPYQLPELYMKQLDPENPYYNVSNSDILLTGELNLDAFTHAWNVLEERHAAFRTTYGHVDGKPVQRIHPKRTLKVSDLYLDRTAVPENQLAAEFSALAGRYSGTNFDFENGPVHVAKIAEFSGKRFMVVFVTHHIMWDERSTIVLAEELTELYNSFVQHREPRLKPLPFQYVDYADWVQRALSTGHLEDQRQYWLGQMTPLPPVLELPTDFERPALQTFNGATVIQSIEVATFRRMQRFLEQHNVTLYMFLLAALDAHLHRLTGQEDFVVGTPIANRAEPELDCIIGCFATAMPMRARVHSQMTFEQLLANVRETCVAAYENHAYPSILAIQELNPTQDLSRSRLFSVMYGLQNNKTGLMERMAFDGMKLDFLRVPTPEFDRAKFDFTLVADQFGEEVVLQWNYNTDLFLKSTAERMLRQLVSLVDQVIADPKQPLHTYQFLTRAERQRVLVDFNQTHADFELDRGISQRFEAQVDRAPDAIALVWDTGTTSYRQLDEEANRWAHVLRENGVRPGDKVAVVLSRSPSLVSSILAVLKAGAAYVPVSPDNPWERQQDIFREAGVRCILTDAPLPAETGILTLRVDVLVQGHPSTRPGLPNAPRSLAYVLFTSGTTGTPRGIEIEHAGVCNLLESTQRDYQLQSSDAVLFLSSYAFDASLLELFWPLVFGGRIVIPAGDDARLPERLVAAILRHGVTVLQCAPLMLDAIVKTLDPRPAPPSVRLVICGGALLTRELRDRAMARFSCAIANHYGPTEVTVDAARFDARTEFAGSTVPLGTPVSNAAVYVLSAGFELVPVGVIGELWVASPGLARGYLNDPVRTAERFGPNPFSAMPGERIYRTGDLGFHDEQGLLHFTGRIDKQVKVRGNRVELEEIEARLSRHPAVSRCLVRQLKNASGDGPLAAILELTEEVTRPSPTIDGYSLFTLAQRPELRIGLDALHASAWPAYFSGAEVLRSHWSQLASVFPAFQYGIVDEADRVVAAGNALPLRWNGELSDLPRGWDDALVRGFDEAARAVVPNTFMILTGVADETAQGKGLSQIILQGFKGVAHALGLERVIVAVRPTGKSARPDLSFEQWCELRREDGLPVDNWLRSHARVGGRVLRLEPRSQRIEASVPQWELWSGQKFPTSGDYPVKDALQPVHIDLEKQVGVYFDPSVWIEHPASADAHAGGWQHIDATVLREFLRLSVPDYMIPEHFQFLPRMPMGVSGKIDETRALAACHFGSARHRDHVPAQTALQKSVVVLWKNILEVERVGLTDDFFDLGGHSITAMQLLARISDEFGVKVTLKQLFTDRTVQAISRLIEKQRGS